MANNSIVVQAWYPTVSYGMYGVTQGINTGVGNSYGAMYWSTIDSNSGLHPSGSFIYAATSYSRADDLATVTIATTGTAPTFARGSLYAITGAVDTVLNATGMILNVVGGGAGSTVLQFINPGPEVATTALTIGALNAPQPAWTTGFFWSPTYSSQWDTQQAVISAQFEPMYSQRSPQGIDANTTTWGLNFDNRTNREIKGMAAFIQNLQGVYSTPILMPPSVLFNNPTLKYLLTGPKVNTKSFNQNDATVAAKQVFEF